jgi:hypothetical protein
VLVCGVAQCAIGIAQPQLATLPVLPRAAYWIGLICWIGNAAVIAETLAAVPIVADIGGVSLLIPLVGIIRSVGPLPDGCSAGATPLQWECSSSASPSA